MLSVRRIVARFSDATPERMNGGVGVVLGFRLQTARLGTDRIDDYADLGPAPTVPAVGGLGKVLRVLRAARVALPQDPLQLVGHAPEAAELLERAVGASVRLSLRPRFRQDFVAWTERGVETIRDVIEVREYEDAYVLFRRNGRFPVRLERSSVIRQRTNRERWHEVLDIERP